MKVEVDLVEVINKIPTKIKLGAETYLLTNVKEAEISQPAQLTDTEISTLSSRSVRKKRKPKDAVFLDKSYHHWVTKKEIKTIEKILLEAKKPIEFGIFVEKTKMKVHHIRSTLLYLRKQNMVIRNWDGDGLVTYQSIDKKT